MKYTFADRLSQRAKDQKTRVSPLFGQNTGLFKVH